MCKSYLFIYLFEYPEVLSIANMLPIEGEGQPGFSFSFVGVKGCWEGEKKKNTFW